MVVCSGFGFAVRQSADLTKQAMRILPPCHTSQHLIPECGAKQPAKLCAHWDPLKSFSSLTLAAEAHAVP